MIEARGLIKRYGSTLAVDDLSFTIRPGLVTGFLGPNGAGKTTTMRLILGLDYPAAGTVTVNGLPYPRLASPMREVGALLDARAVHGGRSAYNHLLCLAQTNDIPRRRVDEVLGIVGLADVARKRSNGFSLGMSQRLGIAAALLGDPAILMFDEPVNGLDPEGIVWIRTLMRSLAAEGRTVLVSSHLMSEMENTADHLLVVGRGRLIADCGMAEFIARSSGQTVLVRTRDPEALARAVIAAGASVRAAGAADSPAAAGGGPAELEVSGLTEEQVGTIALANGIPLSHLAPSRASLEQAFMELTADSVDYHAGSPAGQLTHTGSARGDEESLTWQR
jgi:ABC-2 type transport system ATP-binding protein